MIRLYSIILSSLLVASTFGQTTDLVFFSDDGTLFTLIVDGDVKNAAPATRVVATSIKTETPVVIIKFADAAIPQLRKPGFFALGKEYTLMVTTNKKGERVLRPTGEAELGTAANAEPTKTKPAVFVEDAVEAPAKTGTTDQVDQTLNVGGVDHVTTTTTVVEGGDQVDGENVNINMGVNGVGFNVNVKVDDSMGKGTSTSSSTTTRTTTTTTRSTSTPPPVIDTKPVPKEPETYRMPGYSGRVGCAWPMAPSEFTEAKQSIESKDFEDSKLTLAKQVGGARCFTVDQVKGVMGLFSFEDSKLDFAKFAYERTFDIDNYYKVNDAFTFDGSIDDLNAFIKAR